MKNKDYIGKICIRRGNENQEPRVVFVTGVNSLDMLVCHAVNSGELLMSFPEKSDDLIDFEFNLFRKLIAEWKLENAKRTVVRFQNRLDEIVKDSEVG